MVACSCGLSIYGCTGTIQRTLVYELYFYRLCLVPFTGKYTPLFTNKLQKSVAKTSSAMMRVQTN